MRACLQAIVVCLGIAAAEEGAGEGVAALPRTAALPNLIFVLTDDMGWNTPGYINPLVKTPHIDALAAEGVRSSMYSYKFCSPSRGSFLTGRFPWRLSSTICDGAVCNYLPSHIPMGIHTGYSMLPKRLAEANYISHHVGKWHEGLYAPAFTPLYRGCVWRGGP
jgi:arylsulfatase B